MTPRIRALVATLATLGAVAAAPAVASADTVNVTTAAGLYEAVSQADTSGTPTTIDLAAGTYTLTNGALDLSANITIVGAGSGSDGTLIDANNADRAFHVESGATAEIDGVSIVNGNPAGLADDTCGGGGGPGGAILDDGTLTLKDDSIANSISVGPGGGIDDTGTGPLTISDTTISGNTACNSDGGTGDGGGVAEEGGGTVSIANSTLSGNQAIFGGGIAAEGQSASGASGQVQLSGDTLSGNSAGDLTEGYGGGGGLYVDGDIVDVVNSTITGNTGWDGGGAMSGGGSTTFSFSTIVGNTAKDTELGIGNLMDNSDGGGTTFTLDNSIVAGGVGVDPAATGEFPADSKAPPSNCGPEFANAFQSNGHNLFDDTTDKGAQCGAISTDIINSGIGVGELANNGGPTATMALSPSSPAINAADAALCTSEARNVDQRGSKRPGTGTNCDIGAFEYSPAAAPSSPPATTPSTSTPQNTVTTTNTTTPSADLSLVKRASQRHALVGAKLIYVLTVTNHGPSADTGVKISDRLPRGLSLISEPGACHGRRTITCSVGSLPAGAHATVGLVVRATRVGTVTNTATTTGAVADPKARNNRASATVHVLPLPRCGALVLNDRIDSDDLVPVVQVYIDGRLVRTLHGHNLRHLQLTGPAGMRSFRLRVVFRADDLRNAIATARVRGCRMGAVSWQWVALPGAVAED